MNVPGVSYMKEDVEAAMTLIHHGGHCFNKPNPLESSCSGMHTQVMAIATHALVIHR